MINKRSNKTKSKELIEFLELVGRLEPIEFGGILKIMNINIIDKNKKLRDFEDLISDLIDKFCIIGRKQKRDILKILKYTLENRSDTNGNNEKM